MEIINHQEKIINILSKLGITEADLSEREAGAIVNGIIIEEKSNTKLQERKKIEKKLMKKFSLSADDIADKKVEDIIDSITFEPKLPDHQIAIDKSEIESLQNQKLELETKLKESEEKNTELSKSIEETQSKVLQLEEDSQKANEEAFQKYTEIETQFNELQTKHTEIEAQFNELQAKHTELESQAQLDKENLEREKVEFMAEIETLKTNNESLINEKTNLETNTIPVLQKAFDDYKNEITKKDNLQHVKSMLSGFKLVIPNTEALDKFVIPELQKHLETVSFETNKRGEKFVVDEKGNKHPIYNYLHSYLRENKLLVENMTTLKFVKQFEPKNIVGNEIKDEQRYSNAPGASYLGEAEKNLERMTKIN